MTSYTARCVLYLASKEYSAEQISEIYYPPESDKHKSHSAGENLVRMARDEVGYYENIMEWKP